MGTAFYFLGAPIATYLVRRYHRWQREVIWTGSSVSVIGLLAASFAPDFGTLVATQGVIFGMGILIMYYPVFNMLNEWFIDRRGLALGILCAATGFSGLFYPFVLEVLLDRYGPATTLRVSALALTVLCGPVLPLLHGRYPRSYHENIPKADCSFFKMPLFYIFSLVALLQGMGFYFPMIYLPSFATSLGLSDQMGASLLVVSSFAQMLGQVGFGYSSDLRIKRFWINERLPVETLVFISPLISGIAILGLWGMASSILRLVAFALVYGIFAGGFVVLWARMVRIRITSSIVLISSTNITSLNGGGRCYNSRFFSESYLFLSHNYLRSLNCSVCWHNAGSVSCMVITNTTSDSGNSFVSLAVPCAHHLLGLCVRERHRQCRDGADQLGFAYS